MQWYYSNNGAQSGPVSQEQLAALLADGSLRGDALVWCDGMANWLPAASVPQFQVAPVPGAPPLPPPNPYTAPKSPVSFAGAGQPIPTYLWQALVVTLLCCIPFGIPALVYAAKVERFLKTSDWVNAQQASAQAKKWCLIALWTGLAVNLIWIVVVVVAGVTAAAQQQAGGY